MLKAATAYSQQCAIMRVVPNGKGYYEAMVAAHMEERMQAVNTDWRYFNYYSSIMPCCICGSTEQIGIEPRFGYPVCEEHSKLSPVEISHQRKDRK